MSTRLTDEQVRETLAFLRSGSPLHPNTAREMADNLERHCTALEAERERLLNLVRYCRHELLDKKLITQDEFAAILEEGSAAKLETYDQLRAQIAAADELHLATVTAKIALEAELQEALEQRPGLTRENGSFIPEVYDQILVTGDCGVGGHFRFQRNGNTCLMCQREAQQIDAYRTKLVAAVRDMGDDEDDAMFVTSEIVQLIESTEP